MMDYQEGYCDGLAGHSAQQAWQARGMIGSWTYMREYALGQLDRIAMIDGIMAKLVATPTIAQPLFAQRLAQSSDNAEEVRLQVLADGLIDRYQTEDEMEGFCDGIAGKPAQNRRCTDYREWRDYEQGYSAGFVERGLMLTKQGASA